jgi:hypothetical protein
MDIKIPQEQWGAMIGAAVMASVTQENRDALIQEAIKFLITGERNSYGNISPLQQAFNQAVRHEALKVIEADATANSELTKLVRGVISDAVEKIVVGERREKLVDKVADAIVAGLSLDRY